MFHPSLVQKGTTELALCWPALQDTSLILQREKLRLKFLEATEMLPKSPELTSSRNSPRSRFPAGLFQFRQAALL